MPASGKPALLLAAAAAWLAAPPAQAYEADAQAWTQLNATRAIDGRTDAVLELHGRFTDDASRLGQVLIRPSLTRKLSHGLSVTGGYAFIRNDLSGATSNSEHRAWEQIGYAFARHDGAGLALTGRTRLEQRFREGEHQMAWRVRQMLRADLPLHRRTKVRAVVWNESFFGLNDTSWGARAAVDQTRTFVGLSVPLGEGLRLEPGYELQNVFTGAARANHILAANLFARF